MQEGKTAAGKAKAAPKAKPSNAKPKSAPAPDFSKPIRHVMKTYAEKMNGQKRFTLMVAYFSKGKPGTKITVETVQDAWGKMTKLLGKYNSGYSVWAKDNGWVDSTESKVYFLTPEWKAILKSNA